MPILTPNFSFNLPLVNNPTDADLWGGQLNTNWSEIDTLLRGTTQTETANYSLENDNQNETLFFDTDGGDIAFTLLDPATAGDGFQFTFKKIAAAGTLNIVGDIEGETNPSFTAEGVSLTVVSDGTVWRYVADFSPMPASVDVVLQRKIIQSAIVFSGSSASFEATGIQFSLDNELSDLGNKVRIQVNGYGGVAAGSGNNVVTTIFEGSNDLSGSFDSLGGFNIDTPNSPTEADAVAAYSMFIETTPADVMPETYEIYSKRITNPFTYIIGGNGSGTQILPTTIIIEEIQA